MSLCSVKMSSFIFGSLKMPCSVSTSRSLTQLGLDLALLQQPGLVDQLARARRSPPCSAAGSTEATTSSSCVDDLLLLLFGQVVEVVGQRLVDLLLAVGLGVVEDLLALVAHALQAAADGVDAGGEAALEHGHREAQGRPRAESSGLRP